MITEQQKNIICELLAPYEPVRIGIFGSVARGEERPDSDIDLLVLFKKSISLFDLVGMELDLEEALHRKIDLVTEGALHPRIKPYVEKDIIYLVNEER